MFVANNVHFNSTFGENFPIPAMQVETGVAIQLISSIIFELTVVGGSA